MKYGQNNEKKNVKMYVTSFSTKFYGHMFISSKVIRVLQKKRKRKEEKEVYFFLLFTNKKKNQVMTQFLEACISSPIDNTSLV